MRFKLQIRDDEGTISAIPYIILTLIIFGLFLVGLGPIIDALVQIANQMMGY